MIRRTHEGAVTLEGSTAPVVLPKANPLLRVVRAWHFEFDPGQNTVFAKPDIRRCRHHVCFTQVDIDYRLLHVRVGPIVDITPIIRSPRPQLHAESVGFQPKW